MDNLEAEALERLKKNKLIDTDLNITTQGISTLACLEGTKIYSQLLNEDILPIEIFTLLTEQFVELGNTEALKVLLKSIYQLTEMEEPIYQAALMNLPDELPTYMEEMSMDWQEIMDEEDSGA